jgi:hypothetical protein
MCRRGPPRRAVERSAPKKDFCEPERARCGMPRPAEALGEYYRARRENSLVEKTIKIKNCETQKTKIFQRSFADENRCLRHSRTLAGDPPAFVFEVTRNHWLCSLYVCVLLNEEIDSYGWDKRTISPPTAINLEPRRNNDPELARPMGRAAERTSRTANPTLLPVHCASWLRMATVYPTLP